MKSNARIVNAPSFWNESHSSTVIDVRSPGEYEAGHIPGAINIPLFSDNERAAIGTLYVNQGHDAAVMEGLWIVGPRMSAIADTSREAADDSKKVMVHCWRGGMRSQSMAWLLGVAGLEPTLLKGGYKAFRKLAQNTIFKPRKLMVLSGLTGAGKTRYLKLLSDTGEQVCDLEGLANHRGSAYGGIAQGTQPTTEQFENNLFACLDAFDANRRIWVEDEGNRIGKVVVPQPFYQQLRHAPAVFLDVALQQRIENLMIDYQRLPVAGLIRATDKIRKRLGSQKADQAVAAIERGDLAKAVEITLAYYDRTYLKAAKKMPRAVMQSLPVAGLSDDQVVKTCIKIANQVNCVAQAT